MFLSIHTSLFNGKRCKNLHAQNKKPHSEKALSGKIVNEKNNNGTSIFYKMMQLKRILR